MPGPATAQEARVWIQEAMVQRRYIPDPHLFDRCQDRSVDMNDVKRAIQRCTLVEAYSDPDRKPIAGGTSWRVHGCALDGSLIKVGVDAFTDHLGRRVCLLTVMG